MESIDLAYNLVDLKIKGKAPVQIYVSSLCLKYFRNVVIVMIKGKKRKFKLGKFIYFCCNPPTPQLFTRQNFSNLFFIDT